ncbi:MAG: SPFH domain-containing protein [Bacteroidales bacterium]|nr:SPFH domain-containing protein [Bacteroidales bacterium]
MANNQSYEIDIEELLKKHYKKVIAGVVVLLLVSDAFFQIDPEEVGVITRFGTHVRTVDPGLKTKIPYLETVYKVAVERQMKQDLASGPKIRMSAHAMPATATPRMSR